MICLWIMIIYLYTIYIVCVLNLLGNSLYLFNKILWNYWNITSYIYDIWYIKVKEIYKLNELNQNLFVFRFKI
jgi:hypothetical protein